MQLQPGDHLVTPRQAYSHHGIYVGSGRVIHYSGLADGLKAGPIVEVSLEDFTGGRGMTVKRYSSPVFTGQEVVDRARRRLGENRYDLHANNCEHFCCWAITGNKKSRQVALVEHFMPPVTLLALKARKYSFDNDAEPGTGRQLVEKSLFRIAVTGSPVASVAEGVLTLAKLFKR